ncbi:hypothetical protein [Paracoccus yeei]|uniref:hypothetical protein n=1 Tax=Paracoccus yeei TaxID=147645 RepID=UPI0020C492A4|nr:hypothetical protein [Paracoccus yeei]
MEMIAAPAVPAPACAPPPRWVRRGQAEEALEDTMFHAGAALALLDPLARAEGAPGGFGASGWRWTARRRLRALRGGAKARRSCAMPWR